ncbi:MAG TPA: protein kinase [Polyangiaceae bacterium]
MIQRVPGIVIAARYRLVRQLGVGGMGTVWLAHDLLLDSSCALKLIDDDKARSEEVRVRFAREARVAAQLRGSHVVDVFEHGEWEGIPYISMEFLEGEDLGTRLDRLGRLDPESTYRVIAHVARALSRAHSLGIVHRDLKPENIFLVPGDDGEVAKVLDFGIAKHDAYSLRDKATKTGSFLGTPFYVSPEQARGKDTDHRSDLWSLGVIAFQCLTGAPPFESEALGELMGLILYEDLPLPSHRNADLPPELDRWWIRAAAREREERFQSARELADALGQALEVKKHIAVATLPINRQSFADIPVPEPVDPRLVPAILSGAPGELAARTETDAPLSRTRISSIPLMTRLRGAAGVATSPGRWRGIARGVPRRQLAAAGVLGGIALGVLITVFVTGGNEAPSGIPTTVVAAAVEPLPSPVSPAPRPEVIPTAPAVDTPVDAPVAVAAPSASATSLVGAVEQALAADAGAAKLATAKLDTAKAGGQKAEAAKAALTTSRAEAPTASAKGSSNKRKPPKKSQKRDYGI